MKLLSLLSLSVLLVISCSIQNKSGEKILKGDYRTTKIEDTKNEKSRIVCLVYDKKNNIPIENATVQIVELNSVEFTNHDGICEFEVMKGDYCLTVQNVGNTSIKTKSISINPYTKTEIKFLLGTASIN